MKSIASLLVAGLLVTASSVAMADGSPTPTPAPGAHQGIALLNGDVVARVREQIRLQENRAKELEPIIARDRQARRDVETNWVVLERHAKELHAKANEFREIGKIAGGKAQGELNGFAGELDLFATHD